MNKSYNYKPSEEEEEEFEEEQKTAAADSVGGTPFNVLLQQAGKLKSKQSESLRVKYDKYPPWYQHSMFATDEIAAARKMEFSKRIQVAMSYKEKGTSSLKSDELYDAMHDYERALSIFKWIENLKDDWKKQEIEDSMIKEFEFTPTCTEEAETVRALQCSCLLNLALVYSKQLQWNHVIEACSAVLELDSSSSKALFRRAQARYIPVYCGVTENEIALADLKRALTIQPSDPLIKKEYTKLKRELDQQRAKDSKQFGGLFDRGRVVVEDEVKTNKGGVHEELNGGRMTVEDALRNLKDAESACKRYYDDGRLEDASRLQATVTRLRKDIDEFIAQSKEKETSAAQEPKRNPFLDIDLNNVTPQQLQDAAKSGLDLNDAKVREYIAEIQKELRHEESRSKDTSKSKIKAKVEPKHEMKSVMDRLESRKLVDILSKGWDAPENFELVSRLLINRRAYTEEHEMPTVRVEELDDLDEDEAEEDTTPLKPAPLREDDTPFEFLYEYMLDDVSELYEAETERANSGANDNEDAGGNGFSVRIMDMMDERYQLRAVEKELHGKSLFDWRRILMYTILGFVLFRFFIVPNYNRFCDSYCAGVDCASSLLCSPVLSETNGDESLMDGSGGTSLSDVGDDNEFGEHEF